MKDKAKLYLSYKSVAESFNTDFGLLHILTNRFVDKRMQNFSDI